MQIKIVETIEDWQKYRDYVNEQEFALFNSSILFAKFIKELCPTAKPYYFICMSGDMVLGVLPSFVINGALGPVLNSMPWFGSNPGVICNGLQKVEQKLLESFRDAAKWMNCFSSTIISSPFLGENPYGHILGDPTDSRIGMITYLPAFVDSIDFSLKMERMVHQKTRNQILKALKGCMIYESYLDKDWKFLIDTHKENMSEIGAPVKNKEFEIIKRGFKQGVDYKLYVAKPIDSDETIAALLLKYFNKTVDYLVPATKAQFRFMCPMNGLIFGAMREAAKDGYKYWNWGGTSLPEQEGVYHFKKRFGAHETTYNYYTRLYKPIPAGLTQEKVLKMYPYFYVLPFKLLSEKQDANKTS